jgi:uncharacterized delta-60 repeat protein
VLGLAITAVSGGGMGYQSNAVLTIVDDDAYGVLSFTEVNFFVNERGTNILINVLRTGGDAEEVRVDLATTNLTATDGLDYIGTNVTLIFPDGVRSASVTLPINDDPDLEGNESFAIRLLNFQKAGAGPFTNALVTIIDDEALDVPAGSVDTGFEAFPNSFVNALGLQSDGRLIIGGDFTAVGTFGLNRIARLTIAGTVDPLFHPGTGANDKVQALLIQPDNKIIVGGRFTQINTTNRAAIARLNADGTIDSSFNPGAGADNPVFALALTTGGKIVIGGAFTTVNGFPRQSVAVLDTNGSVDATFTTGAGINGTVYAVAVQPDGKIVIGGDFTMVNNTNRIRIARLNANGSLDLSFSPGETGANAAVRALAVQADGKIVVGGSFTKINGVSQQYIARLQSNGALDPAFNAGSGADGPVLALALPLNNRILVAGDFHSFNGVSRNRITRLNPNGSNDPTINFGTGANSFISAIAVQSNEEIVIGGGFTEFNGVPRNYVARLVGGQNTGAGEFAFLTSTYYVDENGTNAMITVIRKGGTTGSASVQFNTTDGIDFPPYVAANAPGDYTSTNGTLVFPEGETLQTFTVRVNNDAVVEGDKLLFLSLTSPGGGASVDPAQSDAALVILEDDSAISFSSANYSVNEGAVSGHANITVLRTGSTNTSVSVVFTTMANGSAKNGVDYNDVFMSVVFAPGETVKIATVPVIEDGLVEGPESVGLTLSDPAVLNRPDASVELGLASAMLTIVDNDFLPGEFTFLLSTNTVTEGSGVSTVLVVRTNGSSGIVSVRFATVDMSATAGQDYISTNGTLSFADGETVKAFQVSVINDVNLEGDEQFSLRLSNPQGGAVLGAITNEVFIISDDDYIGFATNIFSVNESDGFATITVRRTGNTNLAFTVDFRTMNGSASNVLDYASTNGTLSFASGELAKSFTVRVFDDALVEPIETVILLLTNASANVDLSGVISATLNIIDSTRTVFFVTNSFFVNETDTNAIITVARGGNTNGPVTVTFSTHDITAASGFDYVGTNLLLSFTNGELSKTFAVRVLDDNKPEFTETVSLELGPPGTAYVAPAGGSPTGAVSATLFILNDDLGPGYPDVSFDPGAGAGKFVRALALQPNGRLLVGGAFTNFANSNLNFLARLHTNGAVDTNFNFNAAAPALGTNATNVAATGPSALVSSISLSADGHVAVGGAFSNYASWNGAQVVTQTFNRLVRLTSNGVPDSLFTQPLTFDSALNAVASQADGKILAGGGFRNPLNRIARIRVNGTLDLQFDPGSGADATVNAVVLDPEGKILLAGAFTNVAGFYYPRLARLGTNGILDSTLNPITITNGIIFAMSVASDGRIVIGGSFRYVNGELRGGVARLNADGTLDTSFNPGAGVVGNVYTVLPLANGAVFIGGDFTSVNGYARNRYALLTPSGAVDVGFDSSVGADNTVFASLAAPDQKIYIGGDFTSVGGVARRGVARLNLGDSGQLRIFGPEIVSNAARLRVTSVPGTAYILEGSTNMSYWFGLSTNVASSTWLDFLDPNVSGNSQRFYRARRFGP